MGALLGACLFALFVGRFLLGTFRLWRFVSSAVVVQGIVVDLQERDDDGPLYVVSVRFTTLDGRVVELVDHDPSRRPYVVGSPIRVLYTPGDPQMARVGTPYKLGMRPLHDLVYMTLSLLVLVIFLMDALE